MPSHFRHAGLTTGHVYCGVGGELLEALLERARAEGHGRISLNVRRDSKEQSFYARHDFEPLRDDDGSVTMVATV